MAGILLVAAGLASVTARTIVQWESWRQNTGDAPATERHVQVARVAGVAFLPMRRGRAVLPIGVVVLWLA